MTSLSGEGVEAKDLVPERHVQVGGPGHHQRHRHGPGRRREAFGCQGEVHRYGAGPVCGPDGRERGGVGGTLSRHGVGGYLDVLRMDNSYAYY